MNDPTESISFNLSITDPCFSATVDLSSGVIPDLSPSYTVGEAEQTQTFTFANIVDSMTAGLCPAFAYDVVMHDDTAIDTALFTFDATAGTLKVVSTDRTIAATYNMKLTAKYNEAIYTNVGEQAFTYTVVDPCPTATLTLAHD